MSTNKSAGFTQLARERLAKFNSSAELRDADTRYGSWVQSYDGRLVIDQLAILAIALVTGKIPVEEYRSHFHTVGVISGMPLRDLLLFAKCSREFNRCLLACSGKILFDPIGWDAEDGVI